jgi:hypothetical protein
MDVARRLLAAILVGVFALGAVACDAQGSVNGDGANAELDAEGGGEGEGD